jgi:hypothetical protein
MRGPSTRAPEAFNGPARRPDRAMRAQRTWQFRAHSRSQPAPRRWRDTERTTSAGRGCRNRLLVPATSRSGTANVRIAASDVRERMHGCHRQGRLNAPMPAAGKLLARASRRAQSRCGRENGSWGLPSWFRVRARGSGFCLLKRYHRARSTSAPTFSFVQFPHNARAFLATKLPSYCYRLATICAISIAPPIRPQNRHEYPYRLSVHQYSIRRREFVGRPFSENHWTC